MAAPDFFDQRREWSRWKHRMLRRYLPAFAGILGWRNKNIYYVDCFAGAGKYGKDESIAVSGSPIIAAEIAVTIENAAKWPYKLHCIHIEPNRKNYLKLCEATAGFPANIVTNMHGLFRDKLDDVLATIVENPVLLLLDPYCYKGMEWDALEQLARRTLSSGAKTELLINFNAQQIDVKTHWLRSSDKKARAFVSGLNAAMGTEEWQDIVRSGREQAHRMEMLTNLYASRLANLFKGSVVRYPVRDSKGKMKYYMLYVTRHVKGVKEISSVIYKVEEEYKEEVRNNTQGDFFDLIDPSPDDIVRQLADDIYAHGRSVRRVTFGQLQNKLVMTWVGRVDVKHYRAACKLLITEGKIINQKPTGIEDKTLLEFA